MAIQAARLQVVVGADTRQAESELKSFSSRMGGIAKNMGLLGAGLSVGLTAPLVGAGKQALTMAGDFERTMNVLAQVTAAPLDVMKQLEEQALRLGADTSFSAGEAAEAMLELGKAGLDTQEIMGAIPGVLDLAAAGDVGLAQAATVTASALHAFGLEATEAGRIANLLAGGANAAAADITDLAQGIQQGGFAFSAAGQTIDDLVTSVAALTNVGLTGSDAGTALKNAMMRLMNPTKEAKKLMRDLGINVYDASGNMIAWEDVIAEFNEAMAGMTQEEQNAALGTIFLSDGMKAMIPLLDLGRDGFREMRSEVTREGQAAAVAGARMAGLSGAMEYLSGSVESFLIGAAQPFLRFLAGTLRLVANVIDWFGELPEPIRNAALAFAAVLAAAGPTMLAISALAGALAGLATPVGIAITAAAVLGAAIGSMGTEISAFTQYVLGVLADGDKLNDWLTHLPAFMRPAAAAAADFALEMATLWKHLQNISSMPAGTITVGPITVAWTPEIAYVNINDVIQGIWTPQLKKIQVGDVIVGVWTPEIKAIDVAGVIQGSYTPDVAGVNVADVIRGVWTPEYTAIGVGDLILGVWMPKYKTINVGDVITGVWTPDYQTIEVGNLFTGTFRPAINTIHVGDLITGVWTPKAAMVNVADVFTGTLDLTNKVTKLSFGDLLDISGTVGADGKIAVRFTGEDFDIDWSEVVAAMQGKITGFTEEVRTAWETGGWEGVGALARTKISGLATEIIGGVNELVANVQTGLLLGSLAVWGTLRGLSSEQNLDTLADSISGSINALLGALETLGGLQWDVIGLAGPLLTDLATEMVDFANKVASGIDTTAIADTLSGMVTNIASAIDTALDTEKLEDLGTAAGKLIGTFITKLGDFLGTEDFGSQVGAEVAKAGVAFTTGALALATGIATELGKVEWGQFGKSMGNFVTGFMGSLATAIATAEWGPVADAIAQAIGGALLNLISTPRAWQIEQLEEVFGQNDDPKINLTLTDKSRLPVWAGGSLGVNSGDVNTWFSNWLNSWLNSLSLQPSFVGGGVGFSTVGTMGPLQIPVQASTVTLDPLAQAQPLEVPARITEVEPAPNLALDTWFGPGLSGAISDAMSGVQAEAPRFEWPDLPDWEWPALPTFRWPELPTWRWPSIPRPSWLSDMVVPRPSWLGELLSWSPVVTVRPGGGGPIGNNAEGTDYWRGGLTWVGERGPELVSLPRGTRIYSNEESMAMMRGGPMVEITGPVYVRDEKDLDELAYRIAKRLDWKGRGR